MAQDKAASSDPGTFIYGYQICVARIEIHVVSYVNFTVDVCPSLLPVFRPFVCCWVQQPVFLIGHPEELTPPYYEALEFTKFIPKRL